MVEGHGDEVVVEVDLTHPSKKPVESSAQLPSKDVQMPVGAQRSPHLPLEPVRGGDDLVRGVLEQLDAFDRPC
jgi:hypothetical protein